MAFFYASITGTAVLQLKDIPPRPTQYDGRVTLLGVAQDEAALRARVRQQVACAWYAVASEPDADRRRGEKPFVSFGWVGYAELPIEAAIAAARATAEERRRLVETVNYGDDFVLTENDLQ